MLSLPMIAPRAGASLWPSHRISHNSHDDTSNSPPNAASHRRPTSHHGNPHQHNHHQHGRSATSQLLAALSHDENTIEQRKQNVRRFGSGWIRPAGVAKTLQATRDEELEKEEQEMLARREQVMMDLAAAQQDAANAEAREAGEDEEGEEDGQRDLDEEVPEAEASVSQSPADSDSDSDEEGQGSSSAVGENDTTVPFNEDSFIEGSMHEAEVSHMLEMEEAEMAGVLQDERDLDDDVPEAGSYEHTDSELEDDSDEDDASRLPGLSSVRSSRRISARMSARRRSGRRSSGLPSGMGHVPTLQVGAGRGRGLDLGVDLGHGRSSFGIDGSSSIMEGSSFLRSSPAAAASRGVSRNLFEGAMRGGGRGRFG
ncbi:Apc15p protein-domain-containing protein [Phaeosphaeria sp. MPI-PUGE-AT-0046c]|nr:Apc15p protein-domain-containing protein [Phaeosphaeria sp. MPI-PUGE-AT-0046c]